MVIRETKNALSIPMRRSEISSPLITPPVRTNFAPLTKEAPNITGIAIKKENSADADRETPRSMPPRMVDPEREVPGTSDNT